MVIKYFTNILTPIISFMFPVFKLFGLFLFVSRKYEKNVKNIYDRSFFSRDEKKRTHKDLITTRVPILL